MIPSAALQPVPSQLLSRSEFDNGVLADRYKFKYFVVNFLMKITDEFIYLH
jgi:hypothetical protein